MSMTTVARSQPPAPPGARHAQLRQEVREFLAEQSFTPRCDPWVRGFDPAFSRAVGQRGWIGMTWPTELGGGGASNVERWVVAEELLRAGAPVAAHWTADRQTGPSLLRFGTQAQREELLPAIRRGEVVVGLGISESEAGSDLAALRTRAERVDGGWVISGTKIWSSSAHRATHVYVLARTDTTGSRHEGMTEFLLDAGSAGLEIRPILDLTGEHHFNEMHFERVFVPEGRVLGEVGAGWRQITDQLAFERGGPDRYLSTYPLVRAMLRRLRREPDRGAAERLGALTSRLVGLRRLGLELAHELDSGRAPTQLGARLKLLGTHFEQDVVEAARYVLDVCGAEPSDLRLLREALQISPGATIRGGTSEIMRTVVARAEAGR